MRDVLYFDDLYDLASTVDNLMEKYGYECRSHPY